MSTSVLVLYLGILSVVLEAMLERKRKEASNQYDVLAKPFLAKLPIKKKRESCKSGKSKLGGPVSLQVDISF